MVNPLLRLQFSLAKRSGLASLLIAGAKKYHLPPEFVLAVGSRETNLRNILGDGGHGHGVMQIDDRSHAALLAAHPDWRTKPAPLIDYGCSLLADNLAWAKHRFTGMTARQYLILCADAYNTTQDRVILGFRFGAADAKTTGHNYGHDTVDGLMPQFAALLAGKP